MLLIQIIVAIQAMVWTPTPPVDVPGGERICQLILFRGYTINADLDAICGLGGFGSTGKLAIYWAQRLEKHRPTIECTLHENKGKPTQIKLKGLINTGVDVTAVWAHFWPSTWNTVQSQIDLTGIGGMSSSRQSAEVIQLMDPEGQVATTRPYIANCPFNLWGRDVLSMWE